jgi:hypothetical protein
MLQIEIYDASSSHEPWLSGRISHCSSANQVFGFNLTLRIFQEYQLSGRL